MWYQLDALRWNWLGHSLVILKLDKQISNFSNFFSHYNKSWQVANNSRNYFNNQVGISFFNQITEFLIICTHIFVWYIITKKLSTSLKMLSFYIEISGMRVSGGFCPRYLVAFCHTSQKILLYSVSSMFLKSVWNGCFMNLTVSQGYLKTNNCQLPSDTYILKLSSA